MSSTPVQAYEFQAALDRDDVDHLTFLSHSLSDAVRKFASFTALTRYEEVISYPISELIQRDPTIRAGKMRGFSLEYWHTPDDEHRLVRMVLGSGVQDIICAYRTDRGKESNYFALPVSIIREVPLGGIFASDNSALEALEDIKRGGPMRRLSQSRRVHTFGY